MESLNYFKTEQMQMQETSMDSMPCSTLSRIVQLELFKHYFNMEERNFKEIEFMERNDFQFLILQVFILRTLSMSLIIL